MTQAPDAIRRVASALAAYEAPWGIAGGWALDLWRGAVSRPHHDIDVAVLREHQLELRAHLAGWRWTVIERGNPRPWLDGEVLAPPIHELHADRDGESIEVLLNDSAGVDWVYRRQATHRAWRRIAGATCGTPRA